MHRLQDLRQRKLAQWVLAYCAGAWAFLEVFDFLAASFGWPKGLVRALTVLLGVGIAVVLALAWFHGEKGVQRASRGEVAVLVLLLVLAAAGAIAAGRAEGPGSEGSSAHSLEFAVPGSIAVLPFRSISGDSTDEYFSDGFSEELQSALGKVPGLHVAARASSFAFKTRDEDVRTMARALSVAHILAGSVRRSENRIRVAAQLIDGRTGYEIWSERYDRQLSDVLEVQEEIARAIISALPAELVAVAPQRLMTGGTAVEEAYAAYLRGLASRYVDDEVAEKEFIRATQLDPSFARAHSARAMAMGRRASRVLQPEDKAAILANAARSARRALELDSTLAEPHLVFSVVSENRRDWRAERRQIDEAMRREPESGMVRFYSAWAHIRAGERGRAVAEVEWLIARDPLSPEKHFIVANILNQAGSYHRADAVAALGLKLDSLGFGPSPTGSGYLSRGIAQLQLGEYRDVAMLLGSWARVLGWAEQARAARLDALVAGVAAVRAGMPGWEAPRDTAVAILKRVVSGPRPWAIGLHPAAWYLMLGDRERMYQALERDAAAHDPELAHRLAWAMCDPVRNEARFQQLLRAADSPAVQPLQ